MASASLVATVLLAASGLLVMHGIVSASPGSVQAMQDMGALAGPVADVPQRVAIPSPPHESMDLLDCVWVLVGGVMLAAALVWITRWRPNASAASGVLRRMRRRAQRAPPTAVRLSLVGTARC